MKTKIPTYKEFIKTLYTVCQKKNIAMCRVGQIKKDKKYDLFAVYINDIPHPSRTICFSAGVHGNEVAGPLSMIHFLENIDWRTIDKNLRIVLFPLINPFGFDRKKRRSFFNRDINRHFCDRHLAYENKTVYETIAKEHLFLFHSLHEDPDVKKFYAYQGAGERKIFEKIVSLSKKYCPVNTASQIYGDTMVGGIVVSKINDGSLEYRLMQKGVPYVITTETPGRIALATRVELGAKIMHLLLKFSSKY